MTDKLESKDVKVPIARIGYPKLDPNNPAMGPEQDPNKRAWSCTLYFDPSTPAVQAFQKELDDYKAAFKAKYHYDPVKFPTLKPVGEWANTQQTRRTDASLLGLMSMSVSQKEKSYNGEHTFPSPQLFGVNREAIKHTDLYPGCYVRGAISLREYTYLKNKGVTCDLKAVGFVRDGQALGGSTTDYKAFLFADDDELDMDEV